MNKERRRFLRAPLSLTIKYHNPESIVIEERLQELWGGGLFIETFHPLPVNDVITMELFLPGDVGKTVIEEWSSGTGESMKGTFLRAWV